ncbi:unnamed protein product, partial [Ceratitis capitata]
MDVTALEEVNNKRVLTQLANVHSSTRLLDYPTMRPSDQATRPTMNRPHQLWSGQASSPEGLYKGTALFLRMNLMKISFDAPQFVGFQKRFSSWRVICLASAFSEWCVAVKGSANFKQKVVQVAA